MSGILVQKQAVKPIVRKIFKMFITIFLATGFWRTDFEHVRKSMETIFSKSCQKTKLVFSRICYLREIPFSPPGKSIPFSPPRFFDFETFRF